MPLVDPKVWFTMVDAAAFIGVTKGRVAKLIADGRLRSDRAGRTVYVLIADAEAYRASPRKPGRPATKPKKRK